MKFQSVSAALVAAVVSFSVGSAAQAQTGTMGKMAPAAGTKDIVAIAMSDPQFSTLVKAVKAAGLVKTLQGPGPFTVFAPTNAAFAKIPAAKLNALLANKAALTRVLTYHVLPAKIPASVVVGMSGPANQKTVAGATVKVSPKPPMVNNAKIIKTDIMASNGIIHVIDTVLMPPAASSKMTGNKMGGM
ncbi:MAG: fasciclin domain-containing protein [Cytophagales bacterium]|nr:fasciclin domain-containing protein [Armatimonadota bacterium]